ncbi:MAG: hypothetical protein M1832_001536 [Thelocarpon impressellum]|nr:MAG: hypothetical protein M1832_001536 [Thelocarpon impressellum]
MNVIDIYDIADSTWYKQATNGPSPGIRVNPCAVVAAAPDGSSINVYMYGGQNLIPYGSQKQYDDMWILTIPSFTWIQVKMDGQSNPPARAGHTCNVWDGQMVVVGGYVGQDISCDSPGVYVFDMSKLEWQPRFTALSRGEGEKQQSPQEQGKQTDDAKGGSSAIVLDGGYGYTVPVAVQSVVGGNGNGGATVTGPVQSATKGPIATGRPPTFTVTADGGTVTETGKPGSSSGAKQSDGLNVGAVVAGVIAGVLAVLAGYLGFCAWVYRRQLQLYKNHVAMTQRQAAGESTTPEKGGLLGARSSHGSSDPAKWSTSSGPSGGSSAAYAPVAGHAEGSGRPTSLAISSTDDLMAGQEPSFLGVLLSPRRSLRVINRD